MIVSAVLSGIILYVFGPFHLKKVNKLYRKYKPVRITQQKEHLLIWNSETTQNLKVYLHNYKTETAIFLAAKHEKTIFPYKKYIKTAKNGGFCSEELLSENDFEAVLIHFCCYEYIVVPMPLRQFRSED